MPIEFCSRPATDCKCCEPGPAATVQALLMQHVLDSERRESLVMLASDAAGQIPAIAPESHGCVIPWLLRTSGDGVSVESVLLTDATATTKPGDHPQCRIHRQLPRLCRALRTGCFTGLVPPSVRGRIRMNRNSSTNSILGCRSSDRSALATLLRIVIEGRLWASSEAIRGGFRVVSFTEVPLPEFRSRRTYRKHRDVMTLNHGELPFAVIILASAGARSSRIRRRRNMARTTNEAVIDHFFKTSGRGDGWTKDEREWRIVDHVQLNELPWRRLWCSWTPKRRVKSFRS